MKFIITIVVSLFHHCLFGQLSWKKPVNDWDKNLIYENKIGEVLVYEKIQRSTDKIKIAEEMKLVSEASFNIDGQMIYNNCKSCIISTNGSADVIDSFFYDKSKLTRVERVDFVKTTFLYYYDTLNLRRLIVESGKNGGIYTVTLEFLDKNENETSAVGVDFEHTLVYKIVSTRDKLAGTTEEFTLNLWTDFTYSNKFEVFKTSKDFNEIEKAFNSLALDFKSMDDKLFIYYDDKGRKVKTVDKNYGIIVTNFYKDGLIKEKRIERKNNTSILDYHYNYRN